MARGKKPGKGPQNSKDEPRRIRFELEEDAEELFLRHLEQFKPDKREAEEPKEPEKKASKTHKATMVHELDLHGLRLDEAQHTVREFLNGLCEMTGMHRVKIITGKGHHSQQGNSVLAKEIHSFVLQTFRRVIMEIEDSPDQVRLAGVPLRGHFHVTIMGKR
ncbi:MAG TPA: Smr/MutS family protein [Oligoflexus sp.]|uniref:Smr/MutS family protein n=1 Tax=Oligoflexus sp. TaxID=1971216 RepID=UPI002D74339E|nr:Smr/MutS family protein [Oligoflexus sp.]HYX38921.1 Smr/MutS family protein [Oligoflexus sp.]